MNHVEQFDTIMRDINKRRAENYGPVLHNFMVIDQIKRAVSGCPHPTIRHALEMIGVKMARLTINPKHMDSIVDIAGYARTIAMIIDEENDNG